MGSKRPVTFWLPCQLPSLFSATSTAWSYNGIRSTTRRSSESWLSDWHEENFRCLSFLRNFPIQVWATFVVVLCRIKRSSLFDTSLYFRLNEETGVIDYDRMDENAKLFRPKLIVAGASAYAKLIDYKRMRDICDRNGAWLLSDMAHISGALLYQNIMVSSSVLTLIMRPDLSSSSNIFSWHIMF